jgi:phosphoglycerol transferase MdoB-like AlkP superfamily enzyme
MGTKKSKVDTSALFRGIVGHDESEAPEIMPFQKRRRSFFILILLFVLLCVNIFFERFFCERKIPIYNRLCKLHFYYYKCLTL